MSLAKVMHCSEDQKGYCAPVRRIIFITEVKQCSVRTVPDELLRLGSFDAATMSLMLLRMIYIGLFPLPCQRTLVDYEGDP
jgi:hypothetical protein